MAESALLPAKWVRPWNVGDKVEVDGAHDASGDFKFSFSSAVVKELNQEAGELVVAYDEFITEEGEKLTEKFACADKHLRPALPPCLYPPTLDQYTVGETVDIYEDDVWWWAVVTEMMPKSVRVSRLDLDQHSFVVTDPKKLRLGYEWVTLLWRRRVPKKTLLGKFRILAKDELEKLVLDLGSANVLMEDGSVAPSSEVHLRRQQAEEERQQQYAVVRAQRAKVEAERQAEAQARQAELQAKQAEQQARRQAEQQARQAELQARQAAAAQAAAANPQLATQQQQQAAAADPSQGVSLPPQILQQMPQLLQIYRSQPPALMQLLQQGNPTLYAQVVQNPANLLVIMNTPQYLLQVVVQCLTVHHQRQQAMVMQMQGQQPLMQQPDQPRSSGRSKGGRRKRRDSEEEEEDEDTEESTEEEEAEEEEYGFADGLATTRARRAQKSRIVYVDGIPVLKNNMYDINQGEPSVYQEMEQKKKRKRKRKDDDEETEDEQGMGGAAYDSDDDTGQKASLAKQMRAAAKERNPHEQARRAHNESMRGETLRVEGIRAQFLKKHLERLRPFIMPDVVANIEAKATRAPPDYIIPDPPEEQPASIKGEMREYQVQGLQWLVKQYDHGLNAILADEMGLGKTLMTISFLAYLKFDRGVPGPHLIVVPLSVLPNWIQEFKRFAPDLRVVRIHVNDEGERKRLRQEVLSNPGSFDVAVTTYDMVNSIHFGDALKKTIWWRYLVLDEGHRVKNEEALISQGMRQVNRNHVIMLTGTPVQNNLHELYSLLNFMFPDVFTDSQAFDRAFNLGANVIDASKLEAAHYLLRPFLLRRVKGEVESRLPPKVETRINCPLSEFQTFWYRRLLLRDCELLRSVEADAAHKGHIKLIGGPAAATMPDPNALGAPTSGPGSGRGRGRGRGRWSQYRAENEDGSRPAGPTSHWNRMMNLLMQLRKVCNHPYLFNIDAEPHFDGVTTGEDIVEASGKMQVLDRLLHRLQAKGHRVVLFSQFSKMLDILEDYIRLRDWKYKRLDGSTNRIQRMIDIQQFNKPGSDIFMYILCTRAGGLGVNLQTADTCILFDSDWNPQQDLQAMARVHRIGQHRPVHVYRLVSEGTVEERIQKRAESKLYLDQMVNRGSTRAAEEQEDKSMSKGEVLSMLKFGADRIFKNDAGRMPTDEELDAIISRTSMEAEMKAKEELGEGGSAGATAAPAASPAPPALKQEYGAAPIGLKVEGAAVGPGTDTGPSTAVPPPLAQGSFSAALQGALGEDGKPALPQGLVANDQTVANFHAEPAISTFEFAGTDYAAIRQQAQHASLREMARMYWEEKRQRKQRLMKVDGHDVLRENNYDMQQGGISVAVKEKYRRKRRQTAGEDYLHNEYCQICWDGGDLLCCDFCPVALHPHCLGLSSEEVASIRKWGCPHHSCSVCQRNTAAAGGLLFRCEMCEHAFCEDHLPEEYEIMGECNHFQALGQNHPKQACFIQCSKRCQELRKTLDPVITDLMDRHIKRREDAAATAAAAAMPQEEEEGGALEGRDEGGPSQGRKRIPSKKAAEEVSPPRRMSGRGG